MKILWVKSGGLVPLDTGGKIRSFNLLKELARNHDVTFFTFYPAHAGDVHETLKQHFSQVVYLPVAMPAQRGIGEALAYARNLLTRSPYSLSKYDVQAAADSLRSLLSSQKFDILICDFLFSAPIIPWNFPVPKILFTHNVETEIWRRHCQVARNPIWKAVTWREFRTMERAEQEYLLKADHVLTVSGHDQKLFEAFLDPDRITVIPTGVDLDFFRPGPPPNFATRLVFTGSMDWMPNEDAISYFAKEILPLIRLKVSDASLWVVGRRPSPRLQALAKEVHGIHVTGAVDDIRPFVWDAAVYVVPLRVGGGTRIKIFEAMAMGKAVVSTPVGAEGLPVVNEGNVLLAESADAFASQTIRLLQDSNKRMSLERAARDLVEKNFGWAAAAASFEEAFSKAKSQAAQSVPPRPKS